MKILELLESLVDEAATADLYHGTSLRGAVQLLKDNLIKANMTTHSASVPSSVKGHNKTVSLTRDIFVAARFANDKAYVNADVTGVVFVIDQDRLKRDLGKRVRPYDDTSTDWYRQQAGITGNASLRTTRRNELEETVYGDIPNANRYIKHIIVYQPFNDSEGYKMDVIKQSGILDDPRTVVNKNSNDPEVWKKTRNPKGFIKHLGIT